MIWIHSGMARRSTRWIAGVGVLTAAIIVGGAVLLQPGGRGGGSGGQTSTFVVRRGPLTISISEGGTIKARDQQIIKSEVEGQTTIIYLIPEGQLVKEGDLLVELDASRLQDNKIEQLIRVQNKEAAFIRVRENLEVVKSQGASDIAQAELDHRFANEDLSQYVDGEYPNQRNEAKARITLAAEELERATEKMTWSKKLFDEKYISATELELDRLTKSRAELDHKLAVESLELLEAFTYKRQIDELKSNIDQTRMALGRTNRKTQANIIQAEAELKAMQLEFSQQKDKLAKLEQQIEKTKIYTSIDAMVVYATSAKGNWRGNAEPLDEGQSVRERQELIYLPTADSVMAQIKIHESNLAKVRLGLPVQVTAAALPGKIFTGRVARIAPLPDAQSLWLNPDLKIYSTDIHLDGSGSGLRTGMSCRATIVVEHYKDAVQVPVQAIVRVDGKPRAFVLAGDAPERRPVELGLDNNRMVRILDGLEAGEFVLLTPPLDASPTAKSGASPEVGAETPSSDAPSGLTKAGSERNRGSPLVPPEPGPNPEADQQPSTQRMTLKQREVMRKRFESLSPEERESLRQRMNRRPPTPGA